MRAKKKKKVGWHKKGSPQENDEKKRSFTLWSQHSPNSSQQLSPNSPDDKQKCFPKKNSLYFNHPQISSVKSTSKMAATKARIGRIKLVINLDVPDIRRHDWSGVGSSLPLLITSSDKGFYTSLAIRYLSVSDGILAGPHLACLRILRGHLPLFLSWLR